MEYRWQEWMVEICKHPKGRKLYPDLQRFRDMVVSRYDELKISNPKEAKRLMKMLAKDMARFKMTILKGRGYYIFKRLPDLASPGGSQIDFGEPK